MVALFLRKTEIIVIKISRRKRQNPAVLRKYLQLHQSSELEMKSLRVVLSHRDHLPGIFSRIRPQTKKPSQGRRRAKARRAEMLTGDLQPEPNDQKVVRFCCGCFFFAECHMILSARGLQRTDDRNFAATTTP